MTTQERLVDPISTAELERRWSAVRAAMEDQGVDVLIMQNNNEFLGGYVKWFTDIPARNSYPHTILFPRDDKMTVVQMGPAGSERTVSGDDFANRGVAKILTNPSFSSVHYSKNYDAEQVADVLKKRNDRTIGLIGTGGMSHAFCEYLKNANGINAKFIDASELVDGIKAIKSDEECDRIKRTAIMQDEIVAEIAKSIRPGMKDSDVTALAQFTGQKLGSEQGIFLGISAPMGQVARFNQRHHQNRELRDGDYLPLLVENNGAGGFYTEIARTFVLGKASQELIEGLEMVTEAQRYTLTNMKPGTPCKDIFLAHNEFMESRKLPRESRLYAHSQGYDMVERPLIRDDETMAIAENMNFAVHPGYVNDKVFAVICDNYIIGKDGP
ncbi:MAG: M24 family metallopeptidase, partial [Rhodospirillales bacterium]|nr:M24 family metallopeptidase [Rhodospirillales bacterium]